MSVSDGAVGSFPFLQLQQKSDLCFRVFQIPQPIAASIAAEATNAMARTANEMFSVGSVSSSLRVSDSCMLWIVSEVGAVKLAELRKRMVTLVGFVASLSPITSRLVSAKLVPVRIVGVRHFVPSAVVMEHPGRKEISPCPLIWVEFRLALKFEE